ncbi:MAG: hypothetical protein U0P45_09750 [Acidimicrobiales bacterium]
MQIGLVLVAIVALVMAGLDAYQAATGKRLLNPTPPEGEELPPVDDDMRKKWALAAVVAGVVGLGCLVFAFV